MADLKISELNSAANFADADIFTIVQGGENKKITGANMKSSLFSGTQNYIVKYATASTLGNSQIFDNGTNVGVGTTSPQELLHVAGNIRGGTYIDSYGLAFRLWQGNVFRGGVGTGSWSGYGDDNNISVYAVGNIGIHTNNNATPTVVITTSENVGIGTTTPSQKLVVNGSSFFGITDNIVNAVFDAGSNSRLGFIKKSGDFTKLVFGTSSTFAISQSNVSDLLGTAVGSQTITDRIFFNSNGDIGIGAITPTQKLDIDGSIRIRGGSPGAGKLLQSDANGVGSWYTPPYIDGGGTTNAIAKFTAAGTISDSRITDNGTIITYKSNTHSWTNASDTALLSLDSSGNLTATAEVTAFSDKRLKKNVTNYSKGLAYVLSLNPVYYETLEDSVKRIGLIAQDLAEVEPLLVNQNDEYLSVNYQKISMLLINAVKELNQKIDGIRGH